MDMTLLVHPSVLPISADQGSLWILSWLNLCALIIKSQESRNQPEEKACARSGLFEQSPSPGEVIQQLW